MPHLDVVQVGAHVGTGDRVHAGVTSGRLRSGILLEPIPNLFELLRANYGGVDGDFSLINAGLHPTLDEAEMDYIRDGRGLPDWSSAIGTMVPRVRREHATMIEEACGITPIFERITVPCTSFERLFDAHSVDSLGELHIDAEGMDACILQSFPFDRMTPSLVVFEIRHLNAAERENSINLLLDLNYGLHVEGLDYVAEKR